ncbi:uncharacterized protein LOC106166218 [Lingula anatina]|uniref:Small ribosomal subunit protein mS40 n=1 Tax=Lingula anatina TaxID=7574 RepID=A0A1S3IRJ8_LINAN|nr:uncharacterized protein LOC106166218 [Lingula anatina]|eukprot:XP_013400154.1 uncharacterized protein LOC106166218 [Lingula anatina]
MAAAKLTTSILFSRNLNRLGKGIYMCRSAFMMRKTAVNQLFPVEFNQASRWVSTSPIWCQKDNASEEDELDDDTEEVKEDGRVHVTFAEAKAPVEESIAYMQSEVFKERYGDYPVYFYYRRNHKGNTPPRVTRRTCIKGNFVTAGNPCPICRDRFLTVDYRNLDLLKQFVSEETGEVLKVHQTGVCRKQQKKLIFAVEKARDLGFMRAPFHDRYYNYKEYYPHLTEKDVVLKTQPKPPRPRDRRFLTYMDMLTKKYLREKLKYQ